MSTPQARSNLADIDVFRGLAALVVAAMHTRELTWVGIRELWASQGTHLTPSSVLGYATFPLIWGSIGVPIFFVLSGYCIHRSQAMARVRTGGYGLAPGNFLLRRFFRIYPVVAGALLLTCLCDWASRQYFPNSPKLADAGLGTFLINLFSLQGLAGPTYGSNGPLWTLSLEVQFYAVYPLLLMLMWRLGTLRTLLALATLNVASFFLWQRHGTLLFLSFYVSWYLGALVAEVEASGRFTRQLETRRARAVVFAAGFLGLLAGCGVFFLDNYFGFQVWAVAFAVILFAALRRPVPLQGWLARVFAWLGTFSFSLYIVHLPVVVLIHSMRYSSVNQSSLFPFFTTLVAVVAVAYLFSLVFERPALALSQRWKRPAPVLSS